MLVLTRKKHESVVINHNIEVFVVGFDSCGRVRLGFTAPDEIEIYRREVYDAMGGSNPQPRSPHEQTMGQAESSTR